MASVRLAKTEDKAFWFTLDKHLAESVFFDKIRDKQAYVVVEDDKPVGILRYNLFWDCIPFCNMLFVDWPYHKKGYGRLLMERWASDMKALGYDMVMTSTQVDENAQHFYRKLGYKDCGGLVMELPGHEQPMEMFLAKSI